VSTNKGQIPKLSDDDLDAFDDALSRAQMRLQRRWKTGKGKLTREETEALTRSCYVAALRKRHLRHNEVLFRRLMMVVAVSASKWPSSPDSELSPAEELAFTVVEYINADPATKWDSGLRQLGDRAMTLYKRLAARMSIEVSEGDAHGVLPGVILDWVCRNAGARGH